MNTRSSRVSRSRRCANSRSSITSFRQRGAEDIGLLGPLLADRGYDVRYHDAGIERFDVESFLAPDLVIVLGGPIGVYE
jgi:GMP synthase (glutamine-hydrolysing)